MTEPAATPKRKRARWWQGVSRAAQQHGAYTADTYSTRVFLRELSSALDALGVEKHCPPSPHVGPGKRASGFGLGRTHVSKLPEP